MMCLTGCNYLNNNNKRQRESNIGLTWVFCPPYMASSPAFLSCRGGTSVFRKSIDAVGGDQRMIDVINVQS